MKKLSIIFLLIFGFNLSYSQTGVPINFEQLKKKVDKSDADIQNPKKNIKESTWIDRAELMMEVYESQLLNTRSGMPVKEFTILVGQPKNKVQEEQDGNLVDKYIMDRAVFYFVNGTLEKWEVLNPVIENPLALAMESLNKAREIDVNGKKTKSISANYIRLKELLISEGSNCYSFKKYTCAYNSFSTVINIGLLPQLNQKDTAIYYYSALSAQLDGKNKEAVDLYKKAIELGYTSEGNAYSYLEQAYRAIGDNESGLPYLEQGFIKYPKNQNVLIALINYYINKNEDPNKVLTYIDKAIQDDPKNASLYFNKAAIYDKLSDFDKAAEIYQKSIDCDPNFFDAYFNLGAIIYNKGVKYLEEANKVPAKELEKYDALIAKANIEFKNALPYILKANEIKPTDKSTVETLKNIYFRYRTESDEMNKKYLEFKDKSEQLK
ncbi:MAG: tetratricopeptide repeat protein [Bacteroidales bacterium]|nr:tetratricopeptide repeat protein [Bacteroidales bacterium]